MSHIEIDYELEYLSCELADERIESKPVVTTYFDAHFERSEAEGGVINTHLDEHDLDKIYEATLKARVPSGTTSVPITAAVGFASYAQRRNEFGMACYTNAGTGHVKMVEILEGLKTSKNGSYEKRIPLIMETTKMLGEPVKKGEILFRAKAVRMGKRVSFLPLDRCILGGDASTGSSNAEMISQFIQKRVEFEASMQDTWDGIKNVRAPMDISSAGIELTGTCFVPVEGFALCETLDINEEYFQNAFERSMIRKGYRNPSVDYRSLDIAHKAEILAEVCMYASQSFDYISDTVDLSKREPPTPKGTPQPLISKMRPQSYRRIGFEDFHNIGVTASGDCEDSAKLGQVMHYNFRKLSIDAKKYPVLKELQSISEDYVFFLTLATVHGARVNDGVEKVGAHMFGLMLPKDHVKMCMSTTIEGKVWANRLSLAQKADALPTLFCEGTGRIRPLGTGPVEIHSLKPALGHGLVRNWIGANSAAPSHPMSYDPLIKERQYVGQRMRSRGGMKTEISHDYGTPSNFYLGNLLVVTSEFLDVGENLGAFICGKIHRDTRQITRGSDFVELITQQDTVSLIPCAPLPQKIMDITRESASIRAPARPFVLDKSKVDAQFKKHPDLERLKSAINGLKRSGSAPFGSVDHFSRPHQMNAQSVDMMISELTQMDAVFKVDYEFEHITTNLHQYRIMIFVDKDSI